MDKEDKLQRMADIEWFLDALPKWAVAPSRYRKANQTTILSNLAVVRTQLRTLIEDAKQDDKNA